MEIIKLTSNMLFLLETETALPDNQKEALLSDWEKVFPKNQLLIAKKGTLKILEIVTDEKS